MLREWEKIEGCFDKDALDRFEVLAAFVYMRGKITAYQYEQFVQWLQEERSNMEEEAISKEFAQKTLYGFVYKNMGRVKYVINARKSTISRKQTELLKKGVFSTPIFSKTFYYGFGTKPAELNQKFTDELASFATQAYVEELEAAMCSNENITKEQFEIYLRETKQRFGEKAYETLLSYGYRWGIL